MFHSILVPLDGSQASERALGPAGTLAAVSGGEVHLVHVHVAASVNPIMEEGLPVIDAQLQSQAEAHERAYLERMARQVQGQTVATCVTTRLIQGSETVAQTIGMYARQVATDLVVMTTHGRGGFERFWLGSVADSLVRSLVIPLLLLRPTEAVQLQTLPQRILVPLDGSTNAERVLEPAQRLATLSKASLTLLFVEEESASTFDAQHYLQQIAQRLSTAGLQAEVRVVPAQRSVAAVIISQAADFDMVAMATRGRGGAAAMFVGSVTDKVLRGCDAPMLVFGPEGGQRAV
ncbi:universal stress protein [Candidatus Gracilibacteria bacterium]|nr:universal stress protein [Candidatus Gracilibacteria bacterium]